MNLVVWLFKFAWTWTSHKIWTIQTPNCRTRVRLRFQFKHKPILNLNKNFVSGLDFWGWANSYYRFGWIFANITFDICWPWIYKIYIQVCKWRKFVITKIYLLYVWFKSWWSQFVRAGTLINWRIFDIWVPHSIESTIIWL